MESPMTVTRVFAGAWGCAVAAPTQTSAAATTASATRTSGSRRSVVVVCRRCIGRRSGRELDVFFDVLLRFLLLVLGDRLGDGCLGLRVLHGCRRHCLGLGLGRRRLRGLDCGELLLGRQLATLG